ncbi:MAG: radical SAM protein [Candidatus Margulisiibacteriota bacterium]
MPFDTITSQRLSLVEKLKYKKPGLPVRQLGMLLHRKCVPGNCEFCIAGSSPHSTEALTKEQIESALIAAQRSGINILTISGGEPFADLDKLFHTLECARNLGIDAAEITTNGFFATTHKETYPILFRLRDLRLDRVREYGFFPALPLRFSLGSGHNGLGKVPLSSLVNLASAYRVVFPDHAMAFLSVFSPGTPALIDEFVQLLGSVGVIRENMRAIYHDFDSFGSRLTRVVLGSTWQLSFHDLVQRTDIPGRTLRQKIAFLALHEYLEVLDDVQRKIALAWPVIDFCPGKPEKVNRGTEEAFYAGLRPLDRVELFQGATNSTLGHGLVLGWDGRTYYENDFAYGKCLPIGSLDEGFAHAVRRATNDPIYRTLSQKGVGRLLAVTREVFPELTGIENDHYTAGSLMIALLHEPEKALAITRRLIEIGLEEGDIEGECSALLDHPVAFREDRIFTLEDCRNELQRLMVLDWTGREQELAGQCLWLMRHIGIDEFIEQIDVFDFGGLRGHIFWQWLALQPQANLPKAMEKLQQSLALCKKVVNSNPERQALELTAKRGLADRCGEALHAILADAPSNCWDEITMAGDTYMEAGMIYDLLRILSLLGRGSKASELFAAAAEKNPPFAFLIDCQCTFGEEQMAALHQSYRRA